MLIELVSSSCQIPQILYSVLVLDCNLALHVFFQQNCNQKHLLAYDLFELRMVTLQILLIFLEQSLNDLDRKYQVL